MLTCKQVSTALIEADYMKLSPFRRLMLKLHVGTCVVCGKYNRQVMQFHDVFRKFLVREEEPVNQDMPADVRSRLEQYAARLAQGDDTEAIPPK